MDHTPGAIAPRRNQLTGLPLEIKNDREDRKREFLLNRPDKSLHTIAVKPFLFMEGLIEFTNVTCLCFDSLRRKKAALIAVT